jgi:hypothetical protein
VDAYQSRLSKSLAGVLEAKISELTGMLVSTPSPDHSHYSERVGHIKGLQWALKELQDAEEKMSKPEKAETTLQSIRQSYES